MGLYCASKRSAWFMKNISLLLFLLLPITAYSLNILEGKVISITDGDTLKLLVDNQQIKIRLAEIDTPEKRQPYGSRAKQALSDLTFGKDVIAKVQTIDRYGRNVARIYVDDIDVSKEMVRQGAAWVYRKYATDESLHEIEKEAQEAGRGLWALPEDQRIPPWEWRRQTISN